MSCSNELGIVVCRRRESADCSENRIGNWNWFQTRESVICKQNASFCTRNKPEGFYLLMRVFRNTYIYFWCKMYHFNRNGMKLLEQEMKKKMKLKKAF